MLGYEFHLSATGLPGENSLLQRCPHFVSSGIRRATSFHLSGLARHLSGFAIQD